MSKSVVFVISQKGGVGKSTWTRAFVETLRGERSDVSAYDADGGVGQLLQYLGTRDASGEVDALQDPVRGVGYFDVRKDAERGGLVNLIDAGPALAVIDLPGGSFGAVSEVLGDSRAIIDEFVRAGYAVYVVLVITQIKAGTYAVSECLESFGSAPHYVVVKNLAVADEEDFLIFDGYVDAEKGDPARGYKRFGKAREELVAAGGEVIVMPKISPRTYGLLDVEDIPFSVGATSMSLTFQQRAHCRKFLEDFRAQIESSKLAALLPGASEIGSKGAVLAEGAAVGE